MDIFLVDLSLLVVCAALLSYVAVLTKQPIIVAYIIAGIIVGPWGLGLIKEIEFLSGVSHVGITLLLFLVGITLHPRHLLHLFNRVALVTVANALLSFATAFTVSTLFGFSTTDSIYIGCALMFSSTVLVIKLLPTTKLHHERLGAICIGVLILQDLLAIILMIVMTKQGGPGEWTAFIFFALKILMLVVVVFLCEQFVLRHVLRQVDKYHESIFVISLAWCLGVAVLAQKIGLSDAVGGFLAGLALARHPLSLFISEKLKPLRDFFLVLFFFVIGTELNLPMLGKLIIPTIVLAVLFLVLKPVGFWVLFSFLNEEKKIIKEASIRLGQTSEFSILIAVLALQLNIMSEPAAQYVELVTIITMIASSYLVVNFLPTPIGVQKRLKKD